MLPTCFPIPTPLHIYCFRVALTQLRLDVLHINSNIYKYSDCPTNKNCVFCQNQVENEDQFLLVCPLYTDLRNRFLEQKGIQSLQNILRGKTLNVVDCYQSSFSMLSTEDKICRCVSTWDGID